MGRLGTATMRLVELTYLPEEGSEPRKVRFVASHVAFAATEIFKRRYKGCNKQVLSLSDQGPVDVAEIPRRELLKEVIAQAGLLSDLLDGIGAEIGWTE